MRSPALRAVAVFAALCVSASSCTDSVTSDQAASRAAPASQQDLLTGLVGGVLTSVLQRTLPLSQDVSASATIGSAGGSIRIPQAGFTITFPAGAVSSPVTVRATAIKGGSVAYRFEPHGLAFASGKEPVIAQDLSLTAALARLLSPPYEGGYFTDETGIARGVVPVLETRPATFDLLRLRMTFSVRHFSGYAVTAKRSGGYMGSSNDRVGTNTPRL